MKATIILHKQFDACHMSFYGSSRPGKTQSGVDGCAIGLDAMCEADERGKFTSNRIVQPGVQVTNATPCNQAAEALEQAVASGQSIVLFKSDLQGRVFLVVELLGRSETEPAQVEPFKASWPPTVPTRTCVALWWWTWTAPRDLVFFAQTYVDPTKPRERRVPGTVNQIHSDKHTRHRYRGIREDHLEKRRY